MRYASAGWEAKVRFEELVEIMVDADVRELEDQLTGKVAATSTRAVRELPRASGPGSRVSTS